MSSTVPEPLLRVRDLDVRFDAEHGEVHAVRGVDLDIDRGQTLAVVGESGSGKTVSTFAPLRLLSPNARYAVQGSARFEGTELVGASEEDLVQIRGRRIGVVFQDAMGAFNPVRRVGPQIAEMARHGGVGSKAAARRRATDLLGYVGLSDVERRFEQYPHELSGGMRQRALIAVALAGEPQLLLADEPTTALDVTVQAQIIDLLRRLAAERDMATVIITHDMGVVAGLADRVAVMYAGQVVERGTAEQVLGAPAHPYTQALVDAARAVGVGERRVVLRDALTGASRELDGCPFAPRCPLVHDRCRREDPPLADVHTREVACWAVLERLNEGAA